MEFKFKNWNTGIELTSDNINSIKFDNKKDFYEFISYASNEKEADEWFNVYEDNKSHNFVSICKVLVDLFNVDLNDKKIINALYKVITKDSLDQETTNQISTINTEISNLIDGKLQNYNFPIIYDSNLDIAAFLKMCDVQFNFDNKDLLTKMTNYIDILLEFTSYKVLLIPHLYQLLDENQIKELISYIANKNLYIISCITKDNNAIPNKKIIDEQKDEIDIII
ncbi:MAG: type II-A CRISPR-associated protein Csn2 [Mycoplasmataceae bacterium]|nr:type II-A CRISPR-associated protein Csn2 [Mycoplasmataceae bacterium]